MQIIKGSIRAALQEEKLDHSKIINLSSELASLDESTVRFSVDAGIINRLGKELVGRAETALSELVKNGYDSDATTVTLVFKNNNQIGGTLTVTDNGNGMTQQQLVNGFMRLSSTDKIHHPKSPIYKRTRAGKKGIGRFATQRLGAKLTIVTQTATATEAIQVTIDWDKFVTDSNLLAIESKIEIIPARAEGKGTALIIEGLREVWSDTAIKRAYRYLAELLQPYPLSPQLTQSENDPGFRVDIQQQDAQGKLHLIINEQRAYFDQALAVIEGYVDEKGVGFWAVESQSLGIAQEVQALTKADGGIETPFDHLRNIHLKAYYFIFESGLFAPNTITAVRETLKEQGGVRIYRNGFRVLPYGEQDDDWTGLDSSVRRNVVIPPHGNNNFLGFVELVDSEGRQFDETASREKLVENLAFQELSDFTYRTLIGGVLRVAASRNRKGTAGEKRKTPPKPTETIKDAAKDALDAIETMRRDSAAANPPPDSPSPNTAPPIASPTPPVSSLDVFTNAVKAIIGANTQQEQQNTKLIEEINQLRVLAGLGLVIGQFVHEIKTYVTSFNLDIQALTLLLTGNEEAATVFARFSRNIQAFSTYRSYFERTISDNVSRELEPLELRELINPFITTIIPDAEKSGITVLAPVFEGYDLFTVPMHRSEWASILFNFYSNAKKAIHQAEVAGKIFVKCGKVGNLLYVEFSDNGNGIPVEHQDQVFDAFFTTSQPASRQATFREELTGMGLGLKIVRDIVESYRGTIFVALSTPGFSTTLRIQIPLNPKK
ncbi:hypothetical protein BEN47_10865 [Hymenobacter lapidarius]|uniref:histidine kinase n=1 Tax=Hymenobacter lapidarius TaxID=1908237 RepID=A0A1G1T9B1_9BACT|nr:hypothetical protein BEN47_10865 [Hymenobacter lapidarius]